MAGAKMSPRQRMINMMYLVLTALLALNVSKEVLNSFFEVNLGIVKTTESLNDKNVDTYQSFEDATNQKKVEGYKKLSNEVQPISSALVEAIQSMKYALVLAADNGVYLGESSLDEKGAPIEENELTISFDELTPQQKSSKIVYLNAKDDRNSSTDIFNPENKAGQPNVDGKGLASQLRDQIDGYRLAILDILSRSETSGLVAEGATASVVKEINTTLEIKESYGEDDLSWEKYNFYDMPAVGALTLLSKWQADIKRMESEVISFLASNIDASSLKFTSAKATTIPSTNFILKGEEFKSTIFLTAFDETAVPEIYIGDYDSIPDNATGEFKLELKNPSSPLPIDKGMGLYSVRGGSVGPKTYKGFIKILQDEGDKYYSFRGKYIVANKSYTVSPTKMNILYTVIDNPISVSVAGYQPDQVTISMGNQGTIKTVNKKKGEYLVTPKPNMRGKKVQISVAVRDPSGKRQNMGSMEFRVKQVPDPTIYHLDKDKVSKEQIIGRPTLSAKLENFEFEGIVFRVVQFDVKCVGTVTKEFEKVGSINSNVITELKRLKKGDMVSISNIVVKQKGGKTRNMPNSIGFSYTIK